MKEETRRILETYIEKTNYLRSLGFREHMQEVGFSFKANRVEEGHWILDFSQPDNKDRDAFLLTLRMFIQDKDPISFPSLKKLIDDEDLSKNWRTKVDRIRQEYFRYLGAYPKLVDETFFKGHPNNEEILRVMLYGSLVHLDQGKSQKLQEWAFNDIRANVLAQVFTNIVLNVFTLVEAVSDLSEQELNKEIQP